MLDVKLRRMDVMSKCHTRHDPPSQPGPPFYPAIFFTITAFAPLAHGAMGPLDELELIVVPVAIVITVLVWRLRSGHWEHTRRRTRSRFDKDHKHS